MTLLRQEDLGQFFRDPKETEGNKRPGGLFCRVACDICPKSRCGRRLATASCDHSTKPSCIPELALTQEKQTNKRIFIRREIHSTTLKVNMSYVATRCTQTRARVSTSRKG